MLLENFLDEVEVYLDKSKLPPTTFGKQAVGDPQFVFDLRKGREPRSRTVDKVRAFMRERELAA